MNTKNTPKRDGSGKGQRLNRGRGNCDTTRDDGKSKLTGRKRQNRNR